MNKVLKAEFLNFIRIIKFKHEKFKICMALEREMANLDSTSKSSKLRKEKLNFKNEMAKDNEDSVPAPKN